MPRGLNRSGDFRNGNPVVLVNRPGAILGSDLFNRADFTTLSSTGNWLNQTGAPSVNRLVTVANGVGIPDTGGTGSGGGIARWNSTAATFPNQSIQFTVVADTDTDLGLGQSVASALDVPNGYFAGKFASLDVPDNSHYLIVKSLTQVQTTYEVSDVAPAPGDVVVFQIQRVGTSDVLTLYVNGVLLIQATEASPLATGRPAIMLNDSLGSTVTSFVDRFLISYPTSLGLDSGNPVNWTPAPNHFGNTVNWTPAPTHFGNTVNWTPDPRHFGNTITDGA